MLRAKGGTVAYTARDAGGEEFSSRMPAEVAEDLVRLGRIEDGRLVVDDMCFEPGDFEEDGDDEDGNRERPS